MLSQGSSSASLFRYHEDRRIIRYTRPVVDVSAETVSQRKLGKTGYGVDEPRSIIELAVAGGLAVVIGFVVTAYSVGPNPTAARLGLLVGPAVGFLILAVATALYWSSKQGKVREMTKIVASVPWGGDEVVLDLGCGRGLGMVMASKRLTSGYAVGIDLWQRGHLSGNHPNSIWANAAKEGVTGKVIPVKADPSYLPFADSSVDAVLSAVSLHRMIKRKGREAVFTEISRVLRGGGRIGILDAGNGGDYSSLLKKHGMSDVSVNRMRFSSFPPFHVVLARKPFSSGL